MTTNDEIIEQQQEAERQTREAEERERRRQRVRNAYRLFTETEDGRLVLEDLKDSYHYHTTTYVIGDQVGSTRNEGKRTVVLDILDLLEQLSKEPRQ